jgi:sulfatase modifying factor 1
VVVCTCYPGKRPVHEVTVDGFWIDERPVTMGEFGRFVDETGYITVAERQLGPAEYPEADPELLVAGSLVFHSTWGAVGVRCVRRE